MQKILVFISFLCLIFQTAQSQLFFDGQSAQHTWNSCAYDAMGNKYVGGMQDYYLGTQFTLRKYSNMGTILWTINDGACTNGSKIMEVQVATNGDIFVVANLNDNAMLNNVSQTVLGGSDQFLIKYDNNGNYLWHKQLACANSMANIGGLKLLPNSNGNPIILGHFNTNLTIDGVTHPGLGGNPNQPTTVYWVVFDKNTGSVVSYNENPNVSTMTCFTIDNYGSLYYSGYSNSQLVLTRIRLSNNSIVWTQTGSTGAQFYDITSDNIGSIYVTGMCQGSGMNFGGQPYSSLSIYDDIIIGKIDTTTGNVLWVNTFGGVNTDDGKKIKWAIGGKLYVTGFFENSANFDNFTVQSNGAWDIFLARIDPANGSPLWVTHGGNANSDIPLDLEINPINKNVLLTGVSTFTLNDPVIFGPLTFTDTSHIGYWVETLPNACQINGKVFRDMDNNSSLNAADLPFQNVVIQASPVNYFAASGTDGSYQIFTDTGSYSLTIPYPPLYYTATTASPQTAVFTVLGQIDAGNHFGFAPVPGMNDLQVHITPINYGARVGMGEIYHLTYENIGTTTINNAAVSFKFPSGASFNSAVPSVTAVNSDSASWNVGSLVPGQTGFIVVYMNIATGLPINSFLNFTARINPTTGDQNPTDNAFILAHTVVNSWDPNDKHVFPEGNITPTQVAAGQWLTYTVRFQNTGNDVAYNIEIKDALSANLDVASLEILAASHNYDWTLSGNGQLRFNFPNINLPDSGANEVESHGFIQYRIKAKTNLALGTEIKNTAYIYFDFNPAIITNTTNTLVSTTIAVDNSITSQPFTIFPNPAKEEIFVTSTEQIQSLTLYDLTGKKLNMVQNATKMNIADCAKGLYLLEIVTAKGKAINKIVVE